MSICSDCAKLKKHIEKLHDIHWQRLEKSTNRSRRLTTRMLRYRKALQLAVQEYSSRLSITRGDYEKDKRLQHKLYAGFLKHAKEALNGNQADA